MPGMNNDTIVLGRGPVFRPCNETPTEMLEQRYQLYLERQEAHANVISQHLAAYEVLEEQRVDIANQLASFAAAIQHLKSLEEKCTTCRYEVFTS